MDAEIGQILFANGNTYEGGVKKDKLHGSGKLVDITNNTVYEGSW